MRSPLTLVALIVVGCGTSNAPDRNDDIEFCTNERTYACARDLAAARISMSQYNSCEMQIDTMCAAFEWPAGCNPAFTRRDACIDAISDSNRLSTTTDMLPECTTATLCAP